MIIKMKRVTLVAHQTDEEAILRALQNTGALEVIDSGPEAKEGVDLDAAEAKVAKLSGALSILKPFAAKKSMLAPLPEVTAEQIQGELPEALRLSDKLNGISRELSDVRAKMDKNDQLIATLRPWSGFPADMASYQSSRTTHFFTGMLGAADEGKLADIADCSDYQCFSEGSARACVIACPKSELKAVASFLKSIDWTDFAFPKLTGTPAEAIMRLEGERAKLTDQKEQLEQQLAGEFSGCNDLVAGALDAAVIERDRVAAAAELSRTAATFQLEGWAPEDKVQAVEQAVRSVTDAYYFAKRDPAEDETAPSFVENSKFVTPFEVITNLYSRPDPNGLDATPYMAPFYILLFGLMLSDSGYGIVLSIGCWLFLKLKKPTGMMGGLCHVMFWGGLSTVVWGVLVGTFFGLDFDTLLGTKDMFPLLVDPMDNPIGMLILCFGLGVLHILSGVAIKMKMCFDRGDWQGAIFDNLSWILIILGLIGLALPATKTVGMIMAIIGALMILLFKGREKKNPVSRTISGLGELYQISSFLSDILSYARLFALGIATGVIASVFNDICSMLMGSPNIIMKILGIAVACALLVALHLFNIGINTLGAFVHCARLQYVEFYGKFYESGGRAFKPLDRKTKHVRLTQE